jgi:hypothetical protein
MKTAAFVIVLLLVSIVCVEAEQAVGVSVSSQWADWDGRPGPDGLAVRVRPLNRTERSLELEDVPVFMEVRAYSAGGPASPRKGRVLCHSTVASRAGDFFRNGATIRIPVGQLGTSPSARRQVVVDVTAYLRPVQQFSGALPASSLGAPDRTWASRPRRPRSPGLSPQALAQQVTSSFAAKARRRVDQGRARLRRVYTHNDLCRALIRRRRDNPVVAQLLEARCRLARLRRASS